jgi:TonB-linked SusC/RagA family outer membrane protein
MNDIPRWRRRLYGVVIGAIGIASTASAQGGTASVSGVITDRDAKAPVEGARVAVLGTALETQTNARGEYRLQGLSQGRIQVSVLRIGFRAVSDTVRLAAGQAATLNFELQRTVTTLQELVITGTVGNQERRAQAATVGSVDAADIKKTAVITSVNEMLQSRSPGVSVNAASGTAGTSRNIRIRGASSISLSNAPIVFIDGVRFVEGSVNIGLNGQLTDRLNDLNPDDVENIEILKGPAAATLYGADASAGVIQIITKKGRAGSNSFQQSLRAEYGQVNQNWTPPDNYANCTAALVASTSVNPLCRGQAVGTLVHDNPLARTNAFRTGSDELYGWTGRGGGQSYGYFVSGSSDRTLGTLPNNDFKRFAARTNFNWIPTSKVTIEAGLSSIFSKDVLPDNDNNIYGFLGGAELGSPLTRRDDGLPGQDGWFGFARQVNAITAIQNDLDTRRNIFNISGNYVPASWLKTHLTLGADNLTDEVTRFFPKNDVGQYAGALNTGNNGQTRIGTTRYTVDYLADASRRFGRDAAFELNVSGGFQAIATRVDSVAANGQGFATNSSNVITSASTTSAAQQRRDVRQYGYLGQLQLGYRDRLFLQAGARVDNFSAFGANAGSIVLPKVGASWVLSDESFFQPFTGFFSSFRARAVYGTTGRAPVAGASLTTLQPSPYAITISGTTTSAAGAIPLNPGNPLLKPEKGTEFETGFDAAFFHDRARIEATYFNKTTKDLILQQPLPTSKGFQANPFVNIGAVVNRGFEVGLTAELLRMRNVGWESRLNFSTLHNELTDLGGVPAFGTSPNRFTKGYQLGSFVSKRIRKVDVAASTVTVADTFEVVGNAQPTFEASWNNSFTLFKNLRVSALVDTKRGFMIYNLTDYFRETQLVRSSRRLDPNALSAYEKLRRYGDQTPGRPAFVQENGKPTTVDEARDAFLQKGDFVRFRELSFTYDLPRRLLGRIPGAKAASLGLAFQNLALWTDYEGPDPEVISNPTEAFGVGRTDFLTLPNARRALLRMNFSF